MARFGVILLPDSNVSAQLTAFSQAAAAATPAVMALDLDVRPPHMTLVHMECDEEAGWSCWKEFSQSKGAWPSIVLKALRLSTIPKDDYYVPQGGEYFGLDAEKSDELIALHEELLSLAALHNATVVSASGDAFVPHITLGVLEQELAANFSPPAELMNTELATVAVLGRLGDYGTFPEILAR